jgi:hypothetical protein
MPSGFSIPTPGIIGDPDLMFSTAQQLIAGAGSYLGALQAQATQLAAPVINPNFPLVNSAPTPITVSIPALEAVTWNIPAQPAPFTGAINLNGLIIGPFTGTAPTLTFGSPPTPFAGAVPSAPAVNLSFNYPTLSANLPAVPPLLSLDAVAFPTGTIPTFTQTAPTFTVAVPGQFNYLPDTLYTSSLLSQVQADLLQAITDGTWTGLPAAAQQAMLDAAYEREYRTQANAIAALDRDFEMLGYAFPPGAFNDARIKLQTETNYTMAGLSREIMVKQAELQLENVTKARAEAVELEGKLMTYANEVAQRTFEAAKVAVDTAIQVYNAQIEAFKASLSAYDMAIKIYDTQIKGIMAQIEINKNQIEFEHTKAEINTQIVHQYKAEVEAQQTVVDIYKAQIQTIQIQAEIQKIAVEIYSAEIQAYVGQINAFTAQVEGYKASIEAQATIENAYKVSVDAYAAQVNAEVAQINAQVEVFKAQIAAYQAQLAGYEAAIKGMLGQAQAASEYNQAAAEVYRAEVTALASYNDTLTKQWEAVINENEQVAKIGVAAAEANGHLYVAARGLSLDASKVGAQVSAQLGAAAIGAISWHSSQSDSNSNSNSYSTSQSQSTSTSASTSTSQSQSTSTSTSQIQEQIQSE